jgi:REP element-mobilizing transposase RayT
MPRKMRVEYPGVIHHVLSRGDRREDIFLDDVDRQDYLKTLAEACQKTGFQVHAYCLMRNHFHLVVETPQANLVAGLAWLALNRPRQVGAGCAAAPGNHPALKWIAARLRLSASKSANKNLHQWMPARPEPARKPQSGGKRK